VRKIFILATLLLSILFTGCAEKSDVKVAILPEEGGKVGMVEFVDKSGKSYTLSKAWETLDIKKDGKAEVKLSDEKTIMQKYGETIAVMPPKPTSFMIFFGSDSADIDANAKKELENAVADIKNKKASLVICAGHTDSAGKKEYNRALSLKRANSVVKYLVSQGVDKSIIEAHHYGDADPLVKTASGEGHPKNRRVEVIVK
jgi:outer membrane protein OmpA-like peptidoglycan-associated protein